MLLIDLCCCLINFQICEIKLAPLPSLSSHQGTVHLKISYVDNERRECVAYKEEVPDTKRTNADSNGSVGVGSGGGGNSGSGNNDGIIIKLDGCRSLAGDIKIEYYAKQHVMGKKKLFSFWFNTHFVSEKGSSEGM